MKLAKVILESKKVVTRKSLTLTEEDVKLLSETISKKLFEYIDVENTDILNKAVRSAIDELTEI
jgi:hypothetical protein|tara:strand:+ start:468 stop:659 length:192 start_codon:yes stop_codon:yes gene_type:complete